MGRKIVILLGHPGAGKGTQSRAMVRQLDIPHISTGDMLREAVARKTSFGCEAKRSMDAGEMVRDEMARSRALFLQKLAHQFLGSSFVPARLDQAVKNLAFSIDSSP